MLNRKVAIISGGLGDIGRAIALSLADAGAHIAIGDILDDDMAAPMLKELQLKIHTRLRYDCIDVADASAVVRWVESVRNDLGTPEVIIPNAAIVTLKNVLEITPEQWSREMRINLDGAFHLAQAGAKQLLRESKLGRIVFIGSWAAHRPHRHIPAYCVAKAAMRMVCQCMALELASADILVNEIAPGYVDGGLSGRIFAEDPQQRRNATAQVPVARLIAPCDVATEVLHLCDPRNRHMTGGMILMDGGLSLLSGKEKVS